MDPGKSQWDLEPVRGPGPPKWIKVVLFSLAIAAAIWAVILTISRMLK